MYILLILLVCICTVTAEIIPSNITYEGKCIVDNEYLANCIVLDYMDIFWTNGIIDMRYDSGNTCSIFDKTDKYECYDTYKLAVVAYIADHEQYANSTTLILLHANWYQQYYVIL